MRNRTIIVLILFYTAFLFACGSENKRNPFANQREGKGEIIYGGVFHANEVENFKSLFPLNITEVVGHHIANQIYEGLITFSPNDLEIKPCLAESWIVDSTATTYTFTIRKGVFFQNDPCFENGKGREITAHDFKYCFDKLCESSLDNQGFWIFKNRVAGANEYYQSTIDNKPLEGGVSGITTPDDYTLKIQLILPFSSFLSVLGTNFGYVFPKEAVEKYKTELRVKAVGTGPFMLSEVREDENVILIRNPKYWGQDNNGNQLPYLDAIKFSFIKEQQQEFFEFVKGNLDMTYLPILIRDEVVDQKMNLLGSYDRFVINKSTVLVLQYYGFQHQNEVFKNKKVRQAFNYAVDRDKIVQYTLKGDGIAAHNGIVPPAFVEYKAEKVIGYNFDPEKAKLLLKEAGYPNGEGFPKIRLQLNSGGARNFYVAEAIKKMLEENLNINIGYDLLPWPQHLEKMESGKALFFRTGWLADYPDPENFLNLLYSIHIPADPSEKAYINAVRYKSLEYDSLFALALRTIDKEDRFRLYREADQVAVNDAAVMPLFYDERYRLTQKYIQNFPINPMQLKVYKEVYFKENKKTASIQ